MRKILSVFIIGLFVIACSAFSSTHSQNVGREEDDIETKETPASTETLVAVETTYFRQECIELNLTLEECNNYGIHDYVLSCSVTDHEGDGCYCPNENVKVTIEYFGNDIIITFHNNDSLQSENLVKVTKNFYTRTRGWSDETGEEHFSIDELTFTENGFFFNSTTMDKDGSLDCTGHYSANRR